jgi:hypothetical protein
MASGLRGIFRSGLGTGGRFPDEIKERESDVRHAIPIRDNLGQIIRPNLDTNLLHGRRSHKRALRKQKGRLGCFIEEQAAGCSVISGVSVSCTNTNADLHVWTQPQAHNAAHTLFSNTS